MTEPTYTYAQISAAMNRAADDVIEQAGLPDSGARDALNLLVNAVGGYLQGEAANLREVVDRSYGEDYETVIGWIND